MVFTIASINKDLDIYSVTSDTNEEKMVTSSQIVAVMVQGYTFTNAYLTRKGFAVVNNNRTKYIQLEHVTKELDNAIVKRLAYLKAEEEKKKQQMTEAVQKPVQSTQRVQQKRPVIKLNTNSTNKASTDGNIRHSIGSTKSTTLYYKGEPYLSVESLCKKYNRDVTTFKALRAKGYSMDESLGLIPLRPESEVKPNKEIQAMLDSMEVNRGER